MTANNEMGAIQPFREIGAIAKDRGIVFHTFFDEIISYFADMSVVFVHILNGYFYCLAHSHNCRRVDLQKQGYEITYLPVDNEGIISLDDLKNAIREDTICP